MLHPWITWHLPNHGGPGQSQLLASALPSSPPSSPPLLTGPESSPELALGLLLGIGPLLLRDGEASFPLRQGQCAAQKAQGVQGSVSVLSTRGSKSWGYT